MENEVSFVLKLRDFITNPMKKVAAVADAAGNAFKKTQEQIGNYSLEAARYGRYVENSINKTKAAVSSASAAIGAKAATTTATLRKSFTGAYESSEFLNASVAELRERLAAVNEVRFGTVLKGEFRQATREAQALQTQIHRLESGGGRFRTWTKDAFNYIPGSQLLRNPVAIAGAAVVGAVKLGMEQQKNRITFETLAGNKQTGDVLFNKLQQFSTVAPYKQKDILNESQSLLSYGISVKKLMPDLKMLGDIAAGNNEHFKRLALAFGEVKSLGHLAGRQLRQFAALGLNPLVALSKMTGQSLNVLDEKMRKGQISVEMVTKAMAYATGPGGRFHNMMKNINKTFSGQLSMTMNRLGLVLAKIGEAILPPLAAALKVINAVFGWMIAHKYLVIGVFTGLAAALLIGNLEAITASVTFGVLTAATWIMTGAMKLFNLVVKDNPIGLVVGAVIALVIWFGHLWKTSEKFRSVITGVFYVLKMFGTMLKDLVIGRIKELLSGLTGIGKALYYLFSSKHTFGEAWKAGKQAVEDLAGVGTAKKVMGDVNAIRNGAISKAYNAGAEQGRKNFEAAKKAREALSPNTPAGAMAQGNTNLLAGQSPAGTGMGVSTGTDSISSKGPRNLTLNIRSVVEKIVINAVTSQQGINQMEEQVKEALLRILNSANAVMGA